MAFFKFRQRSQTPGEPGSRAAEPAADPRETIDGLRRRARHRLLGALVLVLVAIIGFPLLFDTQPRPVAVDAPIIIPDRDRAPPLRPREAERASAPLAAASPSSAPSPDSRVSASASLSAGEELVPDAVPPASAAPPAASAPPVPTPAAPAASPPRPAVAAQSGASAPGRREETADQAARARRQAEDEARARRQADAARAQALLEGRKPPPAPAASPAAAPPASVAAGKGRFVVQIGAFADAGKARQARQQAERAGLKTYVQDVNTKDGKRTRVRVGPYASRAEAERAAAALKKAGLSGAILSL